MRTIYYLKMITFSKFYPESYSNQIIFNQLRYKAFTKGGETKVWLGGYPVTHYKMMNFGDYIFKQLVVNSLIIP